MKLQHFQSPTARPVTLVLAIPLLTSLGCILRQTVAVRNCYTSRVCTLLHQRAFGHTVMPLACLAASRIRRTQIHVSELMLMNSIVLRRHRACCLPAGARSASARQSTVRGCGGFCRLVHHGPVCKLVQCRTPLTRPGRSMQKLCAKSSWSYHHREARSG